MIYTADKLSKIAWRYLPQDFDIRSKEAVQAWLEDLTRETPASPDDLITLISKYSELSKALSDELSWRYIRMTVNADDQLLADEYNDYYANVYAPVEPFRFRIKQLFYDSPHRKQLDAEQYQHLNRIIANDIEIYRDENVPLQIKESELANKYGSIVSKLSAYFEGEDRTVAQLGVFLKDNDRVKREAAWRLRTGLFAEKRAELDQLFDELKALRIQIAANAGFDNYRDYMHSALGRFSYSPEDLYAFHDAVEKVVIPFVKLKDEHRRKVLKLNELRPWDTVVDLDGRKLQPFQTTGEFIERSIKVLAKVNPEYAKQLEMMGNTGLLELENRKGKAPGGYNTGINDLGSSFIFMNHVKQHNDVVTLLHEAGHAMHSAAMKDIAVVQYTDTPSEVAELASMTMELLSMDYWDEFYDNPEDLKKAKRDQLEGTLSFLPWAMTVDAFQHWIYLHPQASPEERAEAYVGIHRRFTASVDWSGLEALREIGWMMQLHIFEVPFYYIEYGMAQLGALSIYKNYKENPDKALQQYQEFLELGYSRPVSEIYATAGIKFDFSEARIRELVDFVQQELARLDQSE